MKRVRYRAVLFDLFGTLVLLEASSVDPRRFLREAVQSELPDVEFPAFVKALVAASVQIEQERRESCREYSSRERFYRALLDLGREADWERAERLCVAHMRGLASCAQIPPAHLKLVRTLAGNLPIGVVSNFDHGPTARSILDGCALSPYLKTTVISDEHGFRKPHRSIFLHAIEELRVPSGDVLFVGDTPLDDVHGARSAGLDVAWLNRRGEAFPEELLPPTYVIDDLVAIASVLGP